MRIFSLALITAIAFTPLKGVAQATGKNIWILAVGIDTETPSQNFTFFYRTAKVFLQNCDFGLQTKTECHLYINTDPKYYSDPDPTAYNDLMLQLKNQRDQNTIAGSATASDVLKEFKNALKNAGPNDKIIFSLHDHGAPGLLTPSCIFLGNSDKICVDDIQSLIKRFKKSGTKVFVSAEGCFSGGFHELNQKDVCVYAAADRYRFGYDDGDSFWQKVTRAIFQENAPSIANVTHGDISTPYGKGFASNVIRARQCVESKNKVSLRDMANREVVIKMSHLLKNFKNVDCHCESREAAPSELVYNSYFIKEIFGTPILTNEFTDKICATQTETVCNLTKEILEKQKSLDTLVAQLKPIQAAWNVRLQEIIKADQNLLMKIRSFETANEKHPAQSASQIRGLQAQREQLLTKNFKEKVDYFNSVKSVAQNNAAFRSYFESLNRLFEQICFEPADSAASDEENKYNDYHISRWFGDERTPKTGKALKEAVECEQSFTLR